MKEADPVTRSMLRIRGSAVRVSTGVLCLIALASCATPATRQGSGLMPADLVRHDLWRLVDDAQLALRATCLEVSGYPQRPSTPPQATERSRGGEFLDLSEDSLVPASEQAAREKGFGEDAPFAPGSLVIRDPAFEAEYERCESNAWRQIGTDTQSTIAEYVDAVNGLANEAVYKPRAEFRDSARGLELYGLQIACLSDAGYPVDDAEAFRRDSMWSHFGVEVAAQAATPPQPQPKEVPGTVEQLPDTPATVYVPSPQESALAVAWFRCNQQTGYGLEELEALRPEANRVAEEYASQFAELTAKLEVLAADATRLTGLT